MLKFLNSKKGFTLVELMIVVVIMAILVAVAVPIYTAVTKNSEKRTCAANRRELTEQISNYCAGAMTAATYMPVEGVTDTIVISSDGDKGTFVSGTDILNAALFSNFFQKLPYCPAGGTYTITLEGLGDDTVPRITVECDYNDGEHA